MWGEVDAGMCLADGVVVQLIFVVFVAAEKELALFLQEVFVYRLILLYYDQGESRSQFLVCLCSLVTYPSRPVASIPHLIADPHQDLSEGVIALSLNHSPVLFDLSAFLEAINQPSGMCLCQFCIQFFIPLKLVPLQSLHHSVLPLRPISEIRNADCQLLKFLISIHLIQGLAQCWVVSPGGLVSN